MSHELLHGRLLLEVFQVNDVYCFKHYLDKLEFGQCWRCNLEKKDKELKSNQDNREEEE